MVDLPKNHPRDNKPKFSACNFLFQKELLVSLVEATFTVLLATDSIYMHRYTDNAPAGAAINATGSHYHGFFCWTLLSC